MDKEKFRLIIGGQEKPLPKSADFRVEVTYDSKIDEEKIFTEEEVLGLIEQIARGEGIKKYDLEISEEGRDKDGNLIILSARVNPNAAKKLGWESIEFTYMIQGQHGEFGFALDSTISRIYNIEHPETAQGGTVAKYKQGEWEITPGEIAPKADRIE